MNATWQRSIEHIFSESIVNKKIKTYFQGQKSTFFGGKVFFAISQMTPSGRRRRRRRRHRRHRRRTALRRFDLGTNANRFTTKLKPV